MKSAIRTRILVLGMFLGFANACPAHYSMLFLETNSARLGQPVSVIYQWGHPFEHQLGDANAPVSATVLTPSGKKVDVTKEVEPLEVPGLEVQKGWDARPSGKMEMTPLTRPYGLQPGMTFQARVRSEDRPMAATLVEIERYNPTPPAVLPPDEHITRTVKTDADGVFTASLMEPGWWGLTASREGGKKERQGKSYPVRERVTFWAFVDDLKQPMPSK